MSIQRVARRLAKKGKKIEILDVKRINSHMKTTQFTPYVDKNEAKMKAINLLGLDLNE